MKDGIEIESVGNYSRIKILGRILNAQIVRAIFDDLVRLAEAGKDLAIDVTGVSHIDSVGLSLLLALRTRAHRAGTNMVLFGVRDSLKETLRMAGLGGVFKMLDGDPFTALQNNEDF